MVVEEKFLGQYKIPALQAVGWEGIFGMGEPPFFCWEGEQGAKRVQKWPATALRRAWARVP
jgi:hypothetical protein